MLQHIIINEWYKGWTVFHQSAFNSTEQKLSSFEKLQNGWRYGEGIKFSEPAIKETRELYWGIRLAGFSETDVFPGLDGELLLTAYEGEHWYQFERAEPGSWEITHQRGEEVVEVLSGRSLEQAKEYAKDEGQKPVCNAFVSSRNATGMSVNSTSTLWPSSHLPMAVEFQSSF